MDNQPSTIFEPFDLLSTDYNQREEPILKIRRTEPKPPKPPKEIKQKTVADISKLLDKKQSHDSNKKAATIIRIDKYLKNFQHTSADKSYEKKKYDMSEEELNMIEQNVVSQIADKTQFEMGKAVLCDIIAKAPVIVNQFLPPDKRYAIDNLPKYVREHYKEQFEPSWTELIIKYNLFSTGPELRLIILFGQAIQELDSANRNRVGAAVKRAEHRKPMSGYEGL